MLLTIPGVLDGAAVEHFRAALDDAEWEDGRRTTGYLGARVKRNSQLAEDHPVAQQLGEHVLAALERNPLFISAALPHRVFPPMFNRYGPGETFGTHVDTALRQPIGQPRRMRCDLSATLFLSDPETYAGGALTIEDSYGAHAVRLAPGDMVLYPASSLHRVEPVTEGVRLAAIFWVQSMVRDDPARSMLYDLDSAIQHLGAAVPDHPAVTQLTGVYHNLLRRWAEV
jgi:PKHD-type hydroxylase